MAWAWKPRGRGDRPRVVVHGLERGFDGSWDDAVRSAASVTLLAFGGESVVVGELVELGQGMWSGIVLQTTSTGDTPPLGSAVEFFTAQVQAATQLGI